MQGRIPIQIKRIAEDVESAAANINRSLSVEEIQDMVENGIMAHGAFNVARNYIKYRYIRSLARKTNTTDDKILSLISSVSKTTLSDSSVRKIIKEQTDIFFNDGQSAEETAKNIQNKVTLYLNEIM